MLDKDLYNTGYKFTSSRILADSVAFIRGELTRMTTFEVEFPRFILPEFNTHRMLSKNASSSRAVPSKNVLEMVRTNPVVPIAFGKNKAGMQSSELLNAADAAIAKERWLEAAQYASIQQSHLQDVGLHKQWGNRVTEAYQTIKMVVSGTEWKNFFWLRIDTDVQPEFDDLAKKMKFDYETSQPNYLEPGEWHLPYVSAEDYEEKEALMISSSCCAMVSYRKLDTSLEKAKDIYNKLIYSGKPHMSPFEHQAVVPFDSSVLRWRNLPAFSSSWQKGYTAVNSKGQLLSGNLTGFIQHRQLIEQGAI